MQKRGGHLQTGRLGPHPQPARRGHEPFPAPVPEFVSELLPPLRHTRNRNLPPRQNEAGVPPPGHTVGDLSKLAGVRNILAAGGNAPEPGTKSSSAIRYRCGARDAGGQASAMGRTREASCVDRTRQAPWKCRVVESEENQTAVSLPSHRPWKSLRDSHIPTASTIASLAIKKPNSERTHSYPPPTRPSGSSFGENMPGAPRAAAGGICLVGVALSRSDWVV
jgi:hypothetical protein